MKKRFLALLLALTLVFSLMPAALAVGPDVPTDVTAPTAPTAPSSPSSPSAPSSPTEPSSVYTVTFRLHTDTDDWIQPTTVANLPEGATVFDVFRQMLAAEGYTYECADQYCYVQAITAPDGTRSPSSQRGRTPAGYLRVNGDYPGRGYGRLPCSFDGRR